jgi:hypothetical protein
VHPQSHLALVLQLIVSDLLLARARAGRSMPAKMAMMAMTTSNSMRVKPARER